MMIGDDKTMMITVQTEYEDFDDFGDCKDFDFGDFDGDWYDLTWDSCSAQLVRSIVFAFSMLAA